MLKALRLAGVLAFPFSLATPASAQIDLTTSVIGDTHRPPVRLLPGFNPPAGDFRQVGSARRNGLIAALAIDDNFQIGLGRFKVVEPARPRSHMEPERAPTDLRRREKGVAAVGMSLRF